jgi:hypothetical protein
MTRSARVVISIVVASVCGLLVFQNCSQPGAINVADPLKEQREAEALRIAIGADDETVTVGLNQVPNLKMFFVVDNSGTMQKNQFNLSESFGSMFDSASSASLSKFDATTFLINTAQKSPSFTTERATLNNIANQQKNFSPSMQMTLTNFTQLARDNKYNYGYLPGDNIGYNVKSQTSPMVQYTFSPSVVLGDVNDGSNNVTFKPSIRKLASENASVMEGEFKKRLSILNADRFPLIKEGNVYKAENYTVVDNESGLCAVARILRNPENYIDSGEMVSFTIVSDENDNDPEGRNCIQSVSQYTGAEDVVDGICRQRQSTIGYQVPTITPAKCNIKSYKSYNISVAHTTTKVSTNVTYRTMIPAKYKPKFTNVTYSVEKDPVKYTVNYTKVSYPIIKDPEKYKTLKTDLTYKFDKKSYKYKQTKVLYYYEVCSPVSVDGVYTGKEVCVVNTTQQQATVDGDYYTDPTKCYPLAQTKNVKAVNSGNYVPVCSAVTRDYAGTCNKVTDANCIEVITPTDIAAPISVAGLLDAAACLAKAKTYSDYSKDTIPTCKENSPSATSCSAADKAAKICDVIAATYQTKVLASLIQGTIASADCTNYVKNNYSDFVAAGGTPTCEAKTQNDATCPAAQAGCPVIAATTKDSSVIKLAGDYTDAAKCLKYVKDNYSSTYVANTTPKCALATDTPEQASCTATEIANGCVISTPAKASTNVVNDPSGDITGITDACYNLAIKQTDHAIQSKSDVTCVKKSDTTTVKNTTTLDFNTEITKDVDAGNVIADGKSCGSVIGPLAIAKLKAAGKETASDDVCTVTNKNEATVYSEDFSSDCNTQAANRCLAQTSVRGCSGTKVDQIVSFNGISTTPFKTGIKEEVSCASTCKSSKLGVCNNEETSATMKVSDYLASKFGAYVKCIDGGSSWDVNRFFDCTSKLCV